MKPLINLDELELVSHGSDSYQGQYGIISENIGAQKLGYNLTICPPGKKICPFHNHRVNEEMFFILQGEGILRFGDKEYPLRTNDIVACPPGGRDVAHQIINTGTIDLKYLALSTMEPTQVVEFPDSDKISVTVGKPGQRDINLMFKSKQTVDYMEGEPK